MGCAQTNCATVDSPMDTPSQKHAALETVEFRIDVDGRRANCWITIQALQDRFQATRQTAVATLMANMQTIAPVAQRVAQRTPKGERIIVRSRDFDIC
jgi:hypothetical protein